jgi:SAM-dependent methyltransferase
VDPGDVFAGIEMSTERTGAAQLGRLIDLRLSVALFPPLRDVDVPADADSVADRWPELTFSRRHRELVGARPRQPTDRLFDDLYGGADVAVHKVSGRAGGATLEVDLGRWSRPADEVDQMVVARCEPPVLDIGCGPGRMVAALQRSGRAALGIDISAVAVATGRRAGGQVLRRDLALPLAGEGRWGTALLLDGNIGIGGDVPALLRRCRQIVGGGGLIIGEIDTDPERDETYEVVLSRPGCRSAPVPWAAIGIRRLTGVAAALDLIVTEVWEADRRSFVALRTAS